MNWRRKSGRRIIWSWIKNNKMPVSYTHLIFEVVEQMPEFPNGGMAGLMQYLSKNIKYPTIAQENGTQGRVTVQLSLIHICSTNTNGLCANE